MLWGVVTVASDSPWATACDSDVKSLEGIRAVRVNVVHPLSAFENDRIERNPLDMCELQTEAESILTDARIPVCQNCHNDPEVAELLITISTAAAKSASSFIVQVKTEVRHLAELVGNVRLIVMTPTWPADPALKQTQLLTVVSLHEMKDTVKEQVANQLANFVHDYHTANYRRLTCPRLVIGDIGTIRYENTGGFFQIVTDTGWCYEPLNLPTDFAEDGLRVIFQARRVPRLPRPRPAIVRGILVELLWIEALPTICPH